MGQGIEQRLVFVLAVQLDQLCGEFAKRRGGRERPTDERSASALARQLAPDNGFLAIVLENRLDDRVRFAGAYQIGRRPRPEQQADCLHDDGLSCPRLAGEDVEARLELDFNSLDHRKIADPEKTEHARGTLIVSYI